MFLDLRRVVLWWDVLPEARHQDLGKPVFVQGSETQQLLCSQMVRPSTEGYKKSASSWLVGRGPILSIQGLLRFC